MQPYPSSVTPLRGANPQQFGIATPTGPVECKKVMPVSKMPMPGQIVQAVPAAVAAAPTPAGAKIQPQLQHLPRFQPPSFEGANGALPCPDSPGSTPREGSDERRREVEALLQHVPAREDDIPPPVSTKVKRPIVGDSTPGHIERHSMPFPAGTIVEYRSRSSGQWILARVEGFDEANQTYRLDVQPHAQMDRVRARSGGLSPAGELRLEVQENAGFAHQRHTEPAPQAAPLPTLLLHPQQPQLTLPQTAAAATHQLATRVVEEKHPTDADVSSSRAALEIEFLRKQVTRLQAENDALQDRLSREVATKDQYLSELCACHEQLHRLRGSHQ